MFANISANPMAIGAIVILVAMIIFVGWRLANPVSAPVPISTPTPEARPWNIPIAGLPVAPVIPSSVPAPTPGPMPTLPTYVPTTPSIPVPLPPVQVPTPPPAPAIQSRPLTKYVIIRKDITGGIGAFRGFVLTRVNLIDTRGVELPRGAYSDIAYTQGAGSDPWAIVRDNSSPTISGSDGRQEIMMTLAAPTGIGSLLIVTNDTDRAPGGPASLAGTSITLLDENADTLWTSWLAPVPGQVLRPIYSSLQGFANSARSAMAGILRALKST